MTARMLCAALLVSALIGGCSSEAEEPEGLPPVPTGASATAEPTAVAVPSEAAAETPEAAAAFARFFYAEVGRAFAEKDPERIRRLSDPACESCELFIESVASLNSDNERVTPVEFEIVFAEAPALTGEEATVDVIYNLDAVQRYDANNKLVFEEPAVEGREVRLTLVRQGEAWRVKAAEAV